MGKLFYTLVLIFDIGAAITFVGNKNWDALNWVIIAFIWQVSTCIAVIKLDKITKHNDDIKRGNQKCL
jgi:hypothetical protein